MKILESALSLLTLLVGSAVTYLTSKSKKLVDSHLNNKQSALANNVISGLASIANAVVQEFNQKVVVDAKKNGVFTPQLALAVKEDAVLAVKSQGAALLKLGESVLGNMDALVSTLVEQAVVKNK